MAQFKLRKTYSKKIKICPKQARAGHKRKEWPNLKLLYPQTSKVCILWSCRFSWNCNCTFGLLLSLAGLFLVIVTPFSMGMLFLSLLLFASFILGSFRGFVGLILFIVYIGGTMVLFTYCFILSPRQTFGTYSKLYPVGALLLGGTFPWNLSSHIYEFYWLSDGLLCIGVLLFIVILRVVELVDFSRGSMRVL